MAQTWCLSGVLQQLHAGHHGGHPRHGGDEVEAGAVPDGRLDTRLPGAAEGSPELRQGGSQRDPGRLGRPHECVSGDSV